MELDNSEKHWIEIYYRIFTFTIAKRNPTGSKKIEKERDFLSLPSAHFASLKDNLFLSMHAVDNSYLL